METPSDTSGDEQRSPTRSSGRRPNAVIVIIGVVAIGVIVAVIYVMRLLNPPIPASAENPPIYPGAQQIKTEELKVSEGSKGKRIVLRTSDPPEKIYQFYKDTLTKDDWDEAPYRPQFLYGFGAEPDPLPQTLFSAQFQLLQGFDTPNTIAILLLNITGNDQGTRDIYLDLGRELDK